MNQAAIGQYIAGKRTAQGMTQEQLAQKIGVSQKSLMRWETGKRLPDADAVEALCAALGITLPELLNGKDSPQKEEMQLTHDAQMLDLLRRMQRTVYEQHILYGVLLILLGIASNALSALVGGSHVKEFFSGVLMVMSQRSFASISPAQTALWCPRLRLCAMPWKHGSFADSAVIISHVLSLLPSLTNRMRLLSLIFPASAS